MKPKSSARNPRGPYPQDPHRATVFLALGALLLALPALAWLDHRPVAGDPAAAGIQIHVNRDGAAMLRLLPGVGEVRAQAIVAERLAQGPFRTVEDLMRVKGIGPKLAARMAPHVRFGEGAPGGE